MKKSKSSMTTGTGRAPKAPPASRNTFPIVGIGASAGGLEAMTQLLKHLPARTGMAFVLVQHLDPTHESALTSLLSRLTEMPVSEARTGLYGRKASAQAAAQGSGSEGRVSVRVLTHPSALAYRPPSLTTMGFSIMDNAA